MPLQAIVSPENFAIKSSPVVPLVSVILGFLGMQSKRIFSEGLFSLKKLMALSYFEKTCQICALLCFLAIKTCSVFLDLGAVLICNGVIGLFGFV